MQTNGLLYGVILFSNRLRAMNLKYSITSLLLVFLGLVLNYYRQFLFGIVEGYAPRNMVFSVVVLLPIFMLSFGFGVYGFIRELKCLEIGRVGWRSSVLVVLLALPSIVVGVFVIMVTILFLTA